MSAALDRRNSDETLNKFHLQRFRSLSSVITIAAIVYAVLIIQFTPIFPNNRYFLEFFAITAGTANFLIYKFLPASFFKPNVYFALNLMNLAFIAFIVQITGGLASPFVFFYTITLLSSLVTTNKIRSAVLFVLILEFLVLHLFTGATKVTIALDSFANLFLTAAQVVLLGLYSALLVADIHATEKKNLVVGQELKERLVESDLIGILDQETLERKPLKEILDKVLDRTAKEFNAHLGLIVLRTDQDKDWRTVSAHNLLKEGVADVNPENIRTDLTGWIEKNRKTARADAEFIKKHFPALSRLSLSSLLITPLLYQDRLLGLLALGHHHFKFTPEEAEFLKKISSHFSASVAHALALEAQDKLFLENEKIAQDSQTKATRLEKLLEIKGLEA